MASGRVEAQPPNPNPLKSGEGLPSPYPSQRFGSPGTCKLGTPHPPGNLILAATRATFDRLGSLRAPQRTTRSPLGSQSGPTWLPRAHPGLPKTPPKTPQRPLRSSKAQKYNKNHCFFNVFRLAHGCPRGEIPLARVSSRL